MSGYREHEDRTHRADGRDPGDARGERSRVSDDRQDRSRRDYDRADDVGRSAYGRDGFGRDEYDAYGTSSLRNATDHAGKGPKGWQRSSERIRDDVSEALARHSGLDASNIEVEVTEDEVTLTGTVSDRQAKRLAEECAEGVLGVWDVQNHLRVQREGKESSSSTSSSTTDGESGGTNKGKNVGPAAASPSASVPRSG